MSYDLEIGVKVADADELYVCIATPEYASPTYNLGKMFRVCMDWDFEQGKWYRCQEGIYCIERGIRELNLNAKKYRKYEPSNGWGTVESAIRDLNSLQKCIFEKVHDDEIPLSIYI